MNSAKHPAGAPKASMPTSFAPPGKALSGETFAALINLSGRRRFTSQRVILFSVLAVERDPATLQQAREALTIFSDAHEALVKGGGVLPGVFCESLQQAYFGPEKGDAKIRAFIELAERVFHAIEGKWHQASSMLDELVASANPLLAVLNYVTAVYEKEARDHANRAKSQLTNVMSEITSISARAHLVAFNAQIIAARAGTAGREFSVVAGVLSGITAEIDRLVKAALNDSAG